MKVLLPVSLIGCLLAGCAPGVVRTGGAPAATHAAAGLRKIGTLTPPDGPERFDPTAIAVDAKNRILVADRARGTIFVYDKSGPPIGWLSDPPASIGSSRFQDVRSIVTSSGLLAYVLDGGTGFVYSYDLSDQFRGTALNLSGAIAGQRFGRIKASGLAFDPTGRAFVTDVEGDRVLVFDPQWFPSHEIGGPGNTDGGFRDPSGLVFDADGRLFVADPGNRLVQIFDSLGGFLDQVDFAHPPESIVADRNGNVYVGDAVGVITTLPASGGRSEFAPGRGAGPAHLALSNDGSLLYVTRPGRGVVEILKVSAPGDGP